MTPVSRVTNLPSEEQVLTSKMMTEFNMAGNSCTCGNYVFVQECYSLYTVYHSVTLCTIEWQITETLLYSIFERIYFLVAMALITVIVTWENSSHLPPTYGIYPAAGQ